MTYGWQSLSRFAWKAGALRTHTICVPRIPYCVSVPQRDAASLLMLQKRTIRAPRACSDVWKPNTVCCRCTMHIMEVVERARKRSVICRKSVPAGARRQFAVRYRPSNKGLGSQRQLYLFHVRTNNTWRWML